MENFYQRIIVLRSFPPEYHIYGLVYAVHSASAMAHSRSRVRLAIALALWVAMEVREPLSADLKLN